jgi:Glycosyl transferase family 2/Methyltransferase domain
MNSISRPVRLIPQTAQPIEFSCPLCGTVHAAYYFSSARFKIYRCGGCGLTFANQLAPAASGDETPVANKPKRSEEQHRTLISLLSDDVRSGSLLLFADRADSIVTLLEQMNINVRLVCDRDDLRSIPSTTRFNAVIVSDAIMRVDDPCRALKNIRSFVELGTPVIFSLPLVDGSQARLMGRNWHEWQASNRWYFTRETLNLMLLSAGFEQVWYESERRTYSLDVLADRLTQRDELSLWQRGLLAMHRLFPSMLRGWKFPLPSGTNVVSAVAAAQRHDCTVSIIVPVYNEQATVRELLDSLLALRLKGASKQVIIVESNSTDGSRQIVESYAEREGVKVILQPSPRGKGYAVREGLAAATGDIVMIQDADLEYDLDDYEGLLAPVMAWQSMFVLGSRHLFGWKMRKFTDAPLMAVILNLGHQFFRTLVNLALRTQMTDPFTMFKVFRRDALFGIDLLSSRFDLDIELVMKLVRKGYLPLEIPVNYASRSFAEGKKVSFTRDGLTWIGTILRYRLNPIGPGRTSWR